MIPVYIYIIFWASEERHFSPEKREGKGKREKQGRGPKYQAAMKWKLAGPQKETIIADTCSNNSSFMFKAKCGFLILNIILLTVI